MVRVLTERVLVTGQGAERNKKAFFCKSSSRLDFYIIFNVGIDNDMIVF